LQVVQKEKENDIDGEGDFLESEVLVDTLDNILFAAGLPRPRLISITANGAEPEILKGLTRTLSSKVPYISLAVTGSGYQELMSDLNYNLIAYDDRGFTFELRDMQTEAAADLVTEG